jgi:predicted flap endonuclease-1-like 5' DNA nuclease
MTIKVMFQLPAEHVANASEGILLGEFNNWNHSEAVKLSKKDDGSMFAEIDLAPGKSYQYRYLLNDGRWVNDHSTTTFSELYGHTVENCVINVPVASKPKSASKTQVAKKPTADKNAKDDFTKIEGIGKKISELLKKEGIDTFKELSKCSVKMLKTTLESAGSSYKMHNPTTWPKQAKLAAEGKWEELKSLQNELKAGK